MTECTDSENGMNNVSPAARKLAAELGIDLSALQGTGLRGRILLADVERARSTSPPVAVKKSAYQQKVCLTNNTPRGKSIKIRHLLARKMEEAWRTIPHFYVTIPVDMTDVIRFRQELGLTGNDFILAAAARALAEHPWVNATWDGEQGIEIQDINIAFAAATDCGLYYPVLHHCEKLNLRQLSMLAAELAGTATQGQLTEQDVSGGTFTITNMGMYGVEAFGAIITPPQAAALSVGAIKGEVVVSDQGEPTVAPMTRLTLSADHRVLDGADAAEFLGTIKCYLEAPAVLVNE